MKWPFRNLQPALPPKGASGDFAFKRSRYYHRGIDLYCDDLQPVQTIEAGTVVHIEHFTGPGSNPPSPWWNDTWSVMVEGESGVIGYCELMPHDHIKVGTQVFEGETIGLITPVLKQDKGNGTTMLHLEYYVHGTKHHVNWDLDKPQPTELLNPRELLQRLIN